MKVLLFHCDDGVEAKRITELDLDHPPAPGDEINVLGIGDFVVRKRQWEAARIAMVNDPFVHTTCILILYVQPVEAFKRELAQVNSEGA